MSLKSVLLLASVAFALAGARAAPAEPQDAPQDAYQITDLGTLGGRDCLANALNGRGQVVGGAQTAGGTVHAFLWEQGKMRDLGVLPGDGGSLAFAVNGRGEAVGLSHRTALRSPFRDFIADPAARAVVWDGRGIKKLPVGAGSRAVGISETGDIAGAVSDDKTGRAFLLRADKVVYLGDFGGHYSQADAISAAGVAGTSYTAKDKLGLTHGHGFLWAGGRMRDLGIADGTDDDTLDGTGVDAVNDGGQVVGMACADPGLVTGRQHLEGFVWKDGKTRFLGRLPGSRGDSDACGISGGGLVVGWSRTQAGDVAAVLWRDTGIIDLNRCARVPRGWVLDRAQAVNDRGQILCQGYTSSLKSGTAAPGKTTHAFLLTPTSPASAL